MIEGGDEKVVCILHGDEDEAMSLDDFSPFQGKGGESTDLPCWYMVYVSDRSHKSVAIAFAKIL